MMIGAGVAVVTCAGAGTCGALDETVQASPPNPSTMVPMTVRTVPSIHREMPAFISCISARSSAKPVCTSPLVASVGTTVSYLVSRAVMRESMPPSSLPPEPPSTSFLGPRYPGCSAMLNSFTVGRLAEASSAQRSTHRAGAQMRSSHTVGKTEEAVQRRTAYHLGMGSTRPNCWLRMTGTQEPHRVQSKTWSAQSLASQQART